MEDYWYYLEAYPVDEFGNRVEDFELICNTTQMRDSEQAARDDLASFIEVLFPDFDDYNIDLICIDKDNVRNVVARLR